jgi:O-antigen ligase
MDNLKLSINDIKVRNFFTLVFFLTPIVIFFSKFLSDLFLTTVSIYTLIYFIKFKLFSYIKYLIFFFIIIIYFSINLIINNFDIVLIIKSLSLIRFPFFILFAFVAIDSLEFIKKKINFFYILISIFLVNLYSQALFSRDIFGNIYENDYNRVSSFFGYEYIAGGYLFFIFVIVTIITNKFKISTIFFLYLIYIGIFLSGDRTPFIIVNLFLIIFFLINIKKILASQKIIFSTILISILFFCLILFKTNYFIKITAVEKYKGTYNEIIHDIGKKTENEIGLKRWGYYGIFSKSLVIFKNNIFFGTTYKSFRKECDNKKYDEDYSNFTGGLDYNGCSMHPHNIYLEMLSEQGLFGFILLLLLIYNFFKLSNKIINHRDINYNIFLLVFFFPLKPFGSFYTNFGLIMLSSTIALYIFFNKKILK